ncbi:MAG TPA: AMP-binding protein [Candidatus Nanopelagicaceae bacterium]
MENSSHRELLCLGESPIPEVMVGLSAAFVGTGPALCFAPMSQSHVPSPVAIVVATSGSTGGSKEVGITANALLASAKASNEYLGAKYGEVWSLLLPLTHVAGINVLVRSLELGTTPIDLREATEYPKADFTAIVPTQLFRALNGDRQLLNHLKNCRAVLVGGAALSDSIRQAAAEAGIEIVTTYGMTETCGGCVYNGTPISGVEVDTSSGTIKIKGPMIAYTYLNDEQAWRDSYVDGWFLTNDLGSFVNSKLVVEGRADDVIISGGEKVSLSAVEGALQEAFKENEFAAFAIPDAEWGSALHIAIAGDHPISTQEISSYLEKTLGVVAKPKGFLILSALPMIGVGKVDQKALAQAVLERKALADDLT